MSIIQDIEDFYRRCLVRRKWRQKNMHNFTYCANSKEEKLFPIDKVQVGKYSYGPLHVISYGKNDAHLYIGAFCSIAKNVRFLLGGEHNYHRISTYPFKAKFFGEDEVQSKGDIIVEDDVWIGYGTTILSGCTLARGTIVAAGSVVVKSTEPYSIVGGNPAKVIKKRFPDDIVQKLKSISFAEWDEAYIVNNIEKLYEKID